MTRRQYGSGSVFQRKDGMWIGRFDVGTDRNGRRRSVQVSATSEARCKEKLEEKKREVARMGVPDKSSSRRMTVEAWSKEWLDMIVHELRPKSYSATASTVKQWIVPAIGRKRLDSLTPADIRSVFDAQRKAGKKEGTRIRTHSDLMQLLKAAKLEGHDVPERVFLVKKPKPGENDREAIPLDEALGLLKVIGSREDASLWAAQLLQGLRQGERLGLTWSCVDFERDVVDISWQLQALPYIDRRDKSLGFRVPDGYHSMHLERAWHLVRPKSRRRTIPMVPWMRDALLAWREVAPASELDLVWPDDDGHPRKGEDDRAEWHDIQKLADVRHPAGRPYHLHETRHTTTTLLLELGVDKDIVVAILGWSKLIEAYNHADTLPRQRRALEQLAEHLALTSKVSSDSVDG